MGIENHDLKTVNKLIGSASVDLGLDAARDEIEAALT